MSPTRPAGPRSDYSARIRRIQRAELDDQHLQIPTNEIEASLRTALDLSTTLPFWLVEVQSIARFWQTGHSQEAPPPYFSEDILSGLHGQRIPLRFLIRSKSNRVQLYLGAMSDQEGHAIRSLFKSRYPGSQLWPDKDLSNTLEQDQRRKAVHQWEENRQKLQQIRSFLYDCQHVGVITGLPTPKIGKGESGGTQLDRLIRGLYGSEWAFLITAQPEEDSSLVETQTAILKEQIKVEQEEGMREWRESAGRTVASSYFQLLEMRHQLLEACLFEGGWWVQSYICALDLAVYQRAKALVKSVFSGGYSRMDRIRVMDCPGAGPKVASFSPIAVDCSLGPSIERNDSEPRPLKYHTLLSSGLLSALIHLPRLEMPGYYVREFAQFDVSSHVPDKAKAISVGEILNQNQPTGNPYRVRVEDLTKHCLVIGITGSGKTNTTFYLLQELQKQDTPIPFLVIEPAKREYRQLAKLLPKGNDLRVFTVGEEGENAAPFRFNPFEIRPGVSVQTHIDLLKSVFNASFGMWTPLPQILERAIHEVYRDKGWDPVRSTNDRAEMECDGEKKWHPRAQPTLTDLYHKIGELVPKLGYEEEVTRNVRTALETRINGLRVGAKGMMLDTPQSIPIEYLLESPTVLELEGVGDDEEKAFLIGLILIALYEHYRVQGPPKSSGLRHITVIEEAHRLLKNVPVSTDPESANLGGKAVETFVNMLSEVRAYGEGFIVAEQIPTKLSPDVIKNTSLKIMHRTVANDDRVVMGGAMNLNPAQVRQVVALGTGTAVVHGGGHFSDDNAILVQAPLAKGLGQQIPTGADLRRGWEKFRDKHHLSDIFHTYPTCKVHCGGINPQCADTRRIAEDQAVTAAFASFVLSLVSGSLVCPEDELPVLLHELYANLAEAIRVHVSGSYEDHAWTRCILTHGLYQYLEKRGSQYSWKFEDIDRLIQQLLPAVLAEVDEQEELREGENGLLTFCELYKSFCQLNYEPFYGCGWVCGASPLCLFRYDIHPLIQNEVIARDFTNAGSDFEKLTAVGEQASRHVITFPADSIIEKESRDILKPIAGMCFAIQMVHSDPAMWPTDHRKHTIDRLLDYQQGEDVEKARDHDWDKTENEEEE